MVREVTNKKMLFYVYDVLMNNFVIFISPFELTPFDLASVSDHVDNFLLEI